MLGEWGFRGLTLRTDARALVPRPETESIVGRCLELIADIEEPEVLDLGTGTGAIALSIADERPDARVTAVDTSTQALRLAAENVERTGLPVLLRQGSLETVMEGWDLVVSNPPYVSAAEYEGLQPEIREFEPREALVGEGIHERIAELAQTSWLVFEVGDGQAAGVATAMERLGYRAVAITKDLTDRERWRVGAVASRGGCAAGEPVTCCRRTRSTACAATPRTRRPSAASPSSRDATRASRSRSSHRASRRSSPPSRSCPSRPSVPCSRARTR